MADGTQHTSLSASSEALTVLIKTTIGGLFERVDETDQAALTSALQSAYELGRNRAPYAFDLTAGGRQTIEGKTYLADAKGRMVPVDLVKPSDLLMDEMVRRMMGYAKGVSRTVERFKEHSLADIAAFAALIDQEHGVALGGRKGNMTLTSFDGTLKIQLQIADRLTFGPELQAAKKLVDECLTEWAADSRPEIQAIVQRAFNTDREGQVNRAEMFSLIRLEIEDPRWQRAMTAIRESIRTLGTKEYVRFYERETPTSAWKAVTIDMAAA